MSQSPSFSDSCAASCQCSVRMTETEKDDPQIRQRVYVRMESGLMDQRVVGDHIIKCKRLFQMRPGSRKPAGKHQRSPHGQVTQDKPSGIVTLATQIQQVLSERLRPIQFAANRMIVGLPMG